jgi:hypothetical protein
MRFHVVGSKDGTPLYQDEINRISARIARPGAYFLNLSYEWGCTSSAGPHTADLRGIRIEGQVAMRFTECDR